VPAGSRQDLCIVDAATSDGHADRRKAGAVESALPVISKEGAMASQETPSARGLVLIGTIVFLGSAAIVAGLYRLDPPASALRLDILKSVASGLIQLAVLSVAGVAVKAYFDEHQARRKEARDAVEKKRERRSAINETRKVLLRRVIVANRVVRRARVLIPAHASARTYGQQMRALLDAAFEISDVWHEIETVPGLFSPVEPIKERLVAMERYLETLREEWLQEYQPIVALEKVGNREAVRSALLELAACGDLVKKPDAGPLASHYLPNYYEARDLMRREIWSEIESASGDASR
jgi:hypothetical protein